MECDSSSVCILCSGGLMLNSTNMCQPCEEVFPQCIFCSDSGCSQCESGFYLNSTDSSNVICSYCAEEHCEIC